MSAIDVSKKNKDAEKVEKKKKKGIVKTSQEDKRIFSKIRRVVNSNK